MSKATRKHSIALKCNRAVMCLLALLLYVQASIQAAAAVFAQVHYSHVWRLLHTTLPICLGNLTTSQRNVRKYGYLAPKATPSHSLKASQLTCCSALNEPSTCLCCAWFPSQALSSSGPPHTFQWLPCAYPARQGTFPPTGQSSNMFMPDFQMQHFPHQRDGSVFNTAPWSLRLS